MSERDVRRANTRVAVVTVAIVAGMVGLSFASVPLYRLFCQVTGYAGTPGRADQAPAATGERIITVRFNADIGGTNLPWSFAPVQREVEVRVGEENLIHYQATNRSDRPMIGTATFNVTPAKAAVYFQKIACFCFEEQRLEAGESVDMPVSFFVDPDIAKDPNTRDVATITLSYTFFRAKDEAERLAHTSKSNAGAASPARAN